MGQMILTHDNVNDEKTLTDTPASVTNPEIPAVLDTRAAVSRPLSDYIALGCIVLRVNTQQANEHTVQLPWTLIVVESLHNHYKDPALVGAFAALIHSGWIRAFAQSVPDRSSELWRIYLLGDDVARSAIDGRSKKHVKCLQSILPLLDTSEATWKSPGESSKTEPSRFDVWATPEHSSLFYLFNTLSSPEPDPRQIENFYLRRSVERLLDDEQLPWGLQTSLYPYQRRCAAMMVQKENVQTLLLDPRLEERVSPDGGPYYYGPRDGVFLKSPRYYESSYGGILAETMGLGKTLICISVILMTRGQYAATPMEHDTKPTYARPRSLADTAANMVAKTGLPWKTFFDDHQDYTSNDLSQCKAIMNRQKPTYEIPPRVIRSMRHSEKRGPAEQIRLCHGTIVVVPPNLVHQWQAELAKHVKEGTLKVLVMKDAKVELPPAGELAEYDIVIFSRRRFELENRSIVEVDYTSPLKKLHWLRIIVDEGHGFSSGTTNAAVVAEKLVRAERRWVVTGTPARDLLGVEVDVSAMTSCETDEDFQQYKHLSLQSRKAFDEAQERNTGAVKSIGALASKFLRAKPWCLTLSEEDGATWEDYVYRHEDYHRRTYSGFSQCFRTTLNDLMIKTRPEDVDRDMRLPPLRHDVVRLEPSLVDKMTANLFVLLYTTNAVTSERRDQDYLFHSNSRAHLQRLTANLRQSAFYWTGFNIASVATSLETGVKYLNKNATLCTESDRELLTNTMAAAQQVLASPTWKAITGSSDMGIFLQDWPAGTESSWAFDGCRDPPVVGLVLAVDAMKFVNNQLATEDPITGFEDAGKAATSKTQEEELALARGTLVREVNLTSKSKVGIPSAGFSDGMGSKRVSVTGTSKATPKKPKRKATEDTQTEADSPVTPKSASRKRRKLSLGNTAIDLTSSDPLGRTRITGTTSSKFSYLIDRVSELHEEEKILVFYDAGYVAYYLSQAFDLLNIKHLIYANTLSSEQRSKYIVLFDSDPSHRVLVMDIKQAAHGLNLSSASRVFFVNPPWRPDIEAQAIKRAHRIGQTRPVHVETLVLKGTVEEAMYERAAKMTRREHLAARNLEEDEDMRSIIQNAKTIPIDHEEMQGERQMAPLRTPQQLFGRPGRAGKSKQGKMEEEVFCDAIKMAEGKGKGKQRKNVEAGKGKGKKKVKIVEGEAQKTEDAIILGQPDAWQHKATPRNTATDDAAQASSSAAAHASIFGG